MGWGRAGEGRCDVARGEVSSPEAFIAMLLWPGMGVQLYLVVMIMLFNTPTLAIFCCAETERVSCV